MSYIKVQSTEIVWCDKDDRHILIKKEKDVIIGLNYCQGEEIQLSSFEHYMGIDHDLTKFYHAIHQHLAGASELDRINQAIWCYFNYLNILGTDEHRE